MPESRVGQTFTNGPEGVQSFIKAVGDRDTAMGLVHDQLSSTLPRTSEGALDVSRFPRWLERQQRAGVFGDNAFPELEQRFVDAADAATAAKNMRQKSAAALFIGREPADAVKKAAAGGRLGELVDAVKGHDNAEMGLKRAIVEHIRQQAGDKGIIGNSAAIKFLQTNRSDLRRLFTEGHLDQIEKIVHHFSGSGNTKFASVSDLFTLVLGEHVGHAVSGPIGHGLGIAAVAVKKVGEVMRSHGIHRLDELMDEAMLNPQLARTMTERMTPQNSARVLARFGNQMAALTAEAPQNANDRERGALDAVTRGVSSMVPGEAVTEKKLQGLSGRSDISGVRQRLVQRGLLTVQNGRYVRAETTNASPALAPKEAPQPQGAIANPALFENVYKAIQQRQPTLRRQSLRDLNSEIETRPSPYYGSYRPGGLVEHAAAVAQGTPLTHDVVHLLRRSGAIPRDEWSILVTKADGWAKRLGVEGPPAVRREEAVAQAYNHWRSGDMQLPPGLRRIMGGITTIADNASIPDEPPPIEKIGKKPETPSEKAWRERRESIDRESRSPFADAQRFIGAARPGAVYGH